MLLLPPYFTDTHVVDMEQTRKRSENWEKAEKVHRYCT